MTIWILAFVLLASLAGLGYRQGAIRVAFSLIGILTALLLAGPLSPLVKPVLPVFGLKHPVLLWLLPPFVVFLLVLSAFKVGALAAHRKVDVYFKYRAGDLRLALWNRLHARLGLCLGLVNGAFYLVLILFVLHAFSYWTVQLAASEEDPWTVRLVNRAGRDLQSTGLDRVAKAADPLPAHYYDAADLAGLISANPLVESRLARYPTLLEMGERSEFQQLAKDIAFTELRQKRAPFREVMRHPQASAILNNPDLLREVWAIVLPDIQDLRAYLETGNTVKYGDEKILGCWSFDFNSAFALYRKANPKLSANQLKEIRKWMSGLFLNTTMVAGTQGFVVVKGLPRLKVPKPGEPPQSPEGVTARGKWRRTGDKYVLKFEAEGQAQEMEAQVSGGRLTTTHEGMPLVFERDT